MIPVLYEDNHLIVVVKPAGMLVQGDATGDVCLLDEIKKYLKEKYKKPGNVFLGLVHRLDRPVTGIVVLAKTSKAASRLSEQFRSHSLSKIYHALVHGQMKEKSGTLIAYLQKNHATNETSVFATPGDGRQRAELAYETVQASKNYSLIKIDLKTGRSHQIRAQLASAGCPIVGDTKYGAHDNWTKGTIALASTSITFKLATSDERKTISMDIPRPWMKFLN